MSTRRFLLLLGLMAPALAPASALGQSDRYAAFTAKAARGGDKLVTRAATYYGAEGHEEFTAAGGTSDGAIVVFGNTWGPKLPGPAPAILGKGQWYELSEYANGKELTDDGKPADPSPHYPNLAGMIVYYDGDLQKIRRQVRFDWAVATIDFGAVNPDNTLLISGRCRPKFDSFYQSSPVRNTFANPEPPPNRRYGDVYFGEQKVTGDTYVAKLSADGTRPLWVWVFEGHRSAASRIWRADDGWVLFELRGLKKVSPDGTKVVEVPVDAGGRLLTVDPRTGRAVSGGDRNSSTGREPWRKPMLYGHDDAGKRAWSIYDWSPKLVGHDEYRLVSDSSLRHAVYDDDGKLLVVGWSDGGNSVLTRNPIDLDRPVPPSSFGMSSWGANVLSVSYFIRIDTKNFETPLYCLWLAYLPGEMGKPNSVSVKEILPLPDGSVAFHGGAATGLIQTPHNYSDQSRNIADGVGYGGPYVSVFNRDFSNLRFSSYIPGCRINALGRCRSGLLVVGRSVGTDGRDVPTATPVVRALQPKMAGGRWDAHLILLGDETAE